MLNDLLRACTRMLQQMKEGRGDSALELVGAQQQQQQQQQQVWAARDVVVQSCHS